MRAQTRKKRWKTFLLKTFLLGLALSVLALSTLVRVDAFVAATGNLRVVPADQAQPADCILVPGAQVRPDGSVSLMLADRLDMALKLYDAGVSQRILVSGDHGTPYYDEVGAMRDYLMERGVPSERIFMDHAGFDTFDSIYRARDVFQVKTCVVVTQLFHLKRALFIASELGVEAQGVDSALHDYGRAGYYRLREIFARSKAFVECRILDTSPTYLGPVIPISGDGNATAG